MESFTVVGLLLRFLLALMLVLITFNPTGYSYAHWFATGFPAVAPPSTKWMNAEPGRAGVSTCRSRSI